MPADDDIDILDRGVVPETGRVPAGLFNAPKEVPGPATTAEPIAPPAALETPKAVSKPPEPPPPTATERLYPRAMEEVETQIEGSRQRETEYRESIKREEEARRRRLETTRPEREAEAREIDAYTTFLREHPREPPAPLPERPKLRYDLGEVFGPNGSGKRMLDAISVFASMSGKTMQERLMFALTAFNGMVEG